jgi:hypothetical protein
MLKKKILTNFDFFGGVFGFLLFAYRFDSGLAGLLGIVVGVAAAHAIGLAIATVYENWLIASLTPQKPRERTKPPEPAPTPQPQANAAENANQEPIAPEPERPKELEDKIPFPNKNISLGSVYFGNYYDQKDYGIWVPPEIRKRHTYLIGKTRTGKTTLIKNLALQDMMQNAGVCFVDPHGSCFPFVELRKDGYHSAGRRDRR